MAIEPHRIEAAKFWPRVKIGSGHECWPWTGAKSRSKKLFYGVFGKRSDRAHRVAWVLSNAATIPPKLLVRHKCDNPKDDDHG